MQRGQGFVGGPSEVMNSKREAFGWHYGGLRFALQIAAQHGRKYSIMPLMFMNAYQKMFVSGQEVTNSENNLFHNSFRITIFPANKNMF